MINNLSSDVFTLPDVVWPAAKRCEARSNEILLNVKMDRNARQCFCCQCLHFVANIVYVLIINIDWCAMLQQFSPEKHLDQLQHEPICHTLDSGKSQKVL